MPVGSGSPVYSIGIRYIGIRPLYPLDWRYGNTDDDEDREEAEETRREKENANNSSSSSSGWGALFPLRFTSSKLTVDGSDSGLLAIEAARIARRLEKEEHEAAVREMKAKREARDKEMKRIEDEMKRKRKDKARESRLKRERENEARLESMGHFPLH